MDPHFERPHRSEAIFPRQILLRNIEDHVRSAKRLFVLDRVRVERSQETGRNSHQPQKRFKPMTPQQRLQFGEKLWTSAGIAASGARSVGAMFFETEFVRAGFAIRHIETPAAWHDATTQVVVWLGGHWP